jgi:uncharacterized membrane protein
VSSGTSGSSPAPDLEYGRDSAEFARVLAFSDGLFAIAMTLLVVGIEVPDIADEDSVGDLAHALGELQPALISFFVSFAVIGRYWLAHHQFIASLRAIDRRLITLNLVYLAFIAFLPFPTALLGNLFENPLSIAVYAVAVALCSGWEVVLFRRAYLDGLLKTAISPEAYRWGTFMSLTPVISFLISIPVAFVDTTLAALCWPLAIPLQIFAQRWRPEDATDDVLGLRG